jgi:hypothetical protein
MELKIGHLTILPFHPWQNPLDATQKIIKDMLISSKTFKRSNKMKKKGYMKRSLPWAGEHKRDQRLGVFFLTKFCPLVAKKMTKKRGLQIEQRIFFLIKWPKITIFGERKNGLNFPYLGQDFKV